MTVRSYVVVAVLLSCAAVRVNAGSIPAGSTAQVRINNTLSSASAHKEEAWSGTLTRDITHGGKVVARAGDPVRGKVTYVKPSGRLHAPGQISLRLTSIKGETVY